MSIARLNEKKRAWLLSSWQIVPVRLPKLGEKVTVSTWPYAFKGFFGYRNFTMTGEDGECLVYANSIWIYLDTETGRPVKVDEEQKTSFPLEEKFPVEYADRKICVPEEMEEQESFQVAKAPKSGYQPSRKQCPVHQNGRGISAGRLCDRRNAGRVQKGKRCFMMSLFPEWPERMAV